MLAPWRPVLHIAEWPPGAGAAITGVHAPCSRLMRLSSPQVWSRFRLRAAGGWEVVVTTDMDASALDYLRAAHRIGELSDQIAETLKTRDRHRQAELRLERAHCEWRLREIWGPWTRQGSQWNDRMWDDINAALVLAAGVAQAVGDSGLVDRLLGPWPRIRAQIRAQVLVGMGAAIE